MGRIEKGPTPKCADPYAYKKYSRILSDMQEGTQCYLVLKHILEHGSITPAEAYRKYGILALHSRISDLRNTYLIPIDTKIKTKKGKHWGVYSIGKEN